MVRMDATLVELRGPALASDGLSMTYRYPATAAPARDKGQFDSSDGLLEFKLFSQSDILSGL